MLADELTVYQDGQQAGLMLWGCEGEIFLPTRELAAHSTPFLPGARELLQPDEMRRPVSDGMLYAPKVSTCLKAQINQRRPAMKKVSTTASQQSRNISQQRLTIGLDLGDRNSCYCVLDEAGRIQLEQRVRTSAKALQEVFGAMPRSRVALEIGTHSPWISRLLSALGHEVIVANARKVRLIGESRKKDDRLDAQTLARLARIDPQLLCPVKHRSAQAQADLMMIRARASLVRVRGAGQRGSRTGEVVRRTLAGLQRAQHESGESRRTEPGTATGAGAVAVGHRRAERTHL